MLFQSMDFALFLPIVFAVYWLLNRWNITVRNLFITASSYFFYGFWDVRFLALIALSSIVDFYIGKTLQQTEAKSKRKSLLVISLALNFGLLGYFKYANFFIESFTDAFQLLGHQISAPSLAIILPVGISFYTFQTLSYTIDIYNRKIRATQSIISFFAFVSFFPQLVAGPIERAKDLLPQFRDKKKLALPSITSGLRQMLWGFFKKLVIADNCGLLVDQVYGNLYSYNGLTVGVAAILFAFQIYADFSGYSDIAIGTARLFGFHLKQNFKNPYFANGIADFWRRWHISLSSWFKDYVYIPLGGSYVHSRRLVVNIIIVFVVSGLWHGANYTFLLWGLSHAIFYLLELAGSNVIRLKPGRTILASLSKGLMPLYTFTVVTLCWVLFRAENLTHFTAIMTQIFNLDIHSTLQIQTNILGLFIIGMLAIEWVNRKQPFGMSSLSSRWWLDTVVVAIVFWSTLLWRANQEVEFIYFQF